MMTILVHFQIKYLSQNSESPQPMRKKDMPNVSLLTTHLLHIEALTYGERQPYASTHRAGKGSKK